MNRHLRARSRLGFLLPVVFCLAGMNGGEVHPADEAERPNILYFYVDDMGWGSIGPNGQAERRRRNLPSVATPNLDQLAAAGVNFTRGYGCHVCSPARASQQSGFHQGHTFADRNDPDNAKKAMRADEILMGDALSAAGYTTGYWGKWGFGGSKDRRNPVLQNLQTLPTSHGYEYVLAELHHVRAHTFFQPTLWRAPAAPGTVGGLELVPNSMAAYRHQDAYPATPALQNDPGYPETAYCDDVYAFAALDFVRAQARRYHRTGKPFFGLLAVQIPHAPFAEIETLPQWDRAYADDPHFPALSDQTRQWAAMVTRIDAHFGNLLRALEDPDGDGDTSDSVADNTLVVFQSDNGGPGGRNNVELDANGGLRGHKGRIQEGGIRVPLIMRWPAVIHGRSKLEAGADCDLVVDVTDLLPTFCELAGVPAPLACDGVSIAPTLRGRGHQRRREYLVHEAANGQSLIRGRYKLVRPKRGPPELYDLETDHAEARDLAARHPALVRELEERLLGERVTEPKGFAVTYHHWTGRDGARASDPDNWSDYRYANAGVTYLFDDGAPRLSWIAHMENRGGEPNTALADADLEFLGLLLRGRPEARQTLVVGSGVRLTGRNEIRLAAHATLQLVGGAVSSLRWVDVDPAARLEGDGTIDAAVYNRGTMAAGRGGEQRGLALRGDYRQGPRAVLQVSLVKGAKVPLRVRGTATLDGQLSIAPGRDFKPAPGQSFTILEARQVVGTFTSPGDTVVIGEGIRGTLQYSESAVRVVIAPR